MLITAEQLRATLKYDAGSGVFFWVNSRRGVSAGQRAGADGGQGYIEIRIDGKKYRAHRLAWLYVYGVWPQEIDHINMDKADNRLNNLRIATHSQNMANRRKMPLNKTGFKGVSQNGSGWRAVIKKNRKFIHIGTYQTPEEAHAAYKTTALKIFGEYARCE